MKTISVITSFMFLVLVGLGIASCSKDNISAPVTKSNPGGVNYHQTAPTEYLDVDGTKIAYRVLGNQPGIPLVLLAPLGDSMDDWDPAVTNGLADKYTVILFDNAGVGKSGGTTPDNIPAMANGAVSFIKTLGYKKVNLLGFSMGSFISQQIALREPALVNKIILTGTGPKGAEGLSNLPNTLASAAGLTPEQVFLVSGFTTTATSQAAGKSAYERIQHRQVDRDIPLTGQAFTAEVKAVVGWAQPDANALIELQAIKQPVLIAQGEKDALVPVVNAINMSKSIPNAQLIVYPDAGHIAIFQYHNEFVQSALNFLGK